MVVQELNQHADVVLAGRSKGEPTAQQSYAAGDAEAQRAAEARAHSDLADLRAEQVPRLHHCAWFAHCAHSVMQTLHRSCAGAGHASLLDTSERASAQSEY